jgi:hypothetical protein
MGQQSIPSLVRRQAELTPGGHALSSVDRNSLTYGQLHRHIAATVKALNNLGVGRHDRVAIVLPNGPEMATAFGADAILVDGLRDLELIRILKKQVDCPLMFNKIAGGKSPDWSLDELKQSGVSLVNYSTPCLFAAQEGIENAMQILSSQASQTIEHRTVNVNVESCTSILNENLARRNAG